MYGNNYKFKESLYNDDPVIRTFTGKYVNVFELKEDHICIEDIAHALSNLCRFGGYTKNFYSVAQHSIIVADYLSPEYKLIGLLHDASEAYLCDLPRPIKNKISEYKSIENNIQVIIASKFNLVYPYPDIIHKCDNLALEYEWDNIVLTDKIKCYTPEKAKKLFLNKFNQLQK